MIKGKSETKESKYKRLTSKSLETTLLDKFMSEYGFKEGHIVAQAIVKDILDITDQYYQDHLKVGEFIWIATIKGQKHFYGRNAHNTKKKPIRLTLVSNEDLQYFRTQKTTYKNFMAQRLARWTKEADVQGTSLTLEDLSILTTYSSSVLSGMLKGFTDEPLLLRGYLEDIGRGTTHKKEIIALFKQNYLTPEIARMTSHSKDAVDRYIKDFQIVKMLNTRFSKEEIPILARKSKGVVEEYLKLC